MPGTTTWKVYQAELVLEEISHCWSLSKADFQFSVNLGTNSVGQFSLPYQRGFISLAPHTPQHSDRKKVSTPRELDKVRPSDGANQQTLPPVPDSRCRPSIASTSLVHIVLGDIFKRSSEFPWVALKSMDPPGKLVGAWALDNLRSLCPTPLAGHRPFSQRLTGTSKSASQQVPESLASTISRCSNSVTAEEKVPLVVKVTLSIKSLSS